MSLLLQFELVMLVLYGIECLAFAPGDSVLAVRATVLRVRLARPWQVTATRRGRVIVAGWMPWDVGLIAAPWPIVIVGDRVVNRPSHALFDDRAVEALPGQVYAADELEAVTFHERELWVNGKKFAFCASRAQAEQVVALLRRWRDAEPGDRGRILAKANRRHLSVRRASRRWVRYCREVVVARVVSVSLVILIFAVLPLVYVNLGLERYWQFLIPAYGGLVAMGGLEIDRLYRQLYPQRVGERWKQVLLTLIAPTHAMRLADHVAHELLSEFHPVVVAKVAGVGEQAEEAARETWLSLHHARLPAEADPPEIEAMMQTARNADGQALDEWFEQQGYAASGWDAPPVRSSEACVAYCPRCGAQYTEAQVGCGACGGLALRVYGEVELQDAR